jgi:hypothetical protein
VRCGVVYLAGKSHFRSPLADSRGFAEIPGLDPAPSFRSVEGVVTAVAQADHSISAQRAAIAATDDFTVARSTFAG